MNKTDFYETKIKSLKNKERIFILFSIVLILVIGALLVYIHRNSGKNNEDDSVSEKSTVLPYFKEVYAIIQNLKYSGIEMFIRDDVTLSLDFKNKVWTLNNLHRFDQAGNIILEKGTDGTCGELAAYTYEHVKPLFGNRYDIKFVKSAQSGFFLTSQDSHITLYITERGKDPSSSAYIIDPSFHKYGKIDDFEDYLFTEYMSGLPFVDKKETGVDFQVRSAIPLFIGGDYLLGFAVETNNGVFDKQNFILALILTKRYKYSGRYLFAIRNNNGTFEKFENKMLMKNVLSDKQYTQLTDKIMLFFNEINDSDIQ